MKKIIFISVLIATLYANNDLSAKTYWFNFDYNVKINSEMLDKLGEPQIFVDEEQFTDFKITGNQLYFNHISQSFNQKSKSFKVRIFIPGYKVYTQEVFCYGAKKRKKLDKVKNTYRITLSTANIAFLDIKSNDLYKAYDYSFSSNSLDIDKYDFLYDASQNKILGNLQQNHKLEQGEKQIYIVKQTDSPIVLKVNLSLNETDGTKDFIISNFHKSITEARTFTQKITVQDDVVRGDGSSMIEKIIIRWFFDSSPRGATVYWRVVSSDKSVKNTNDLYLGNTPYESTKSFNIKGLNYQNANSVQVEVKIEKAGYFTQTKRFNVRQVLDQQEISSFYHLVKED